ncbi:hypothetical protein GCM10022240_01050 [Microbacterium kribbense]|uniref:UspA domain-containing protein n=1 Tax=Microbacterium kribbense TaxID=433645 RepID=A0ABP7FYH7_9MICO
MSDAASEPATAPDHTGAVIVGVVPGEPARVVREAARFAKALAVPLIVANVDVTRFVAYEDPAGAVQTSPIDLSVAGREEEVAQIRREVAAALEGCGVAWSLQQFVGDPAMAIKRLAEEVDACMIVIGTRKRGLGESIREFFTGSVAVRLAHRQPRPVLVVPIGHLAADDEDLGW